VLARDADKYPGRLPETVHWLSRLIGRAPNEMRFQAAQVRPSAKAGLSLAEPTLRILQWSQRR
jgi:hypothetical protein